MKKKTDFPQFILTRNIFISIFKGFLFLISAWIILYIADLIFNLHLFNQQSLEQIKSFQDNLSVTDKIIQVLLKILSIVAPIWAGTITARSANTNKIVSSFFLGLFTAIFSASLSLLSLFLFGERILNQPALLNSFFSRLQISFFFTCLYTTIGGVLYYWWINKKQPK